MKKSIFLIVLALFAVNAFAGALSAARDTKAAIVNRVSVGVYTNTSIYEGGMIALNASGYAVEASDVASILVLGRALYSVDNTTIAGTQTGASGAKSVIVDCGQSFYWNLSDTSTYSNKLSIGQIAYVVDDHTVSVSGSGLSHNAVAGVVADYDSVTGQIAVSPPSDVGVAVVGVGSFSSVTVTNAVTAGSVSDSGTLAVTGVATFTARPVFNSSAAAPTNTIAKGINITANGTNYVIAAYLN
jgi:hypothetical protein